MSFPPNAIVMLARDLKPGDRIVHADGTGATVRRIDTSKLGGVWVHFGTNHTGSRHYNDDENCYAVRGDGKNLLEVMMDEEQARREGVRKAAERAKADHEALVGAVHIAFEPLKATVANMMLANPDVADDVVSQDQLQYPHMGAYYTPKGLAIVSNVDEEGQVSFLTLSVTPGPKMELWVEGRSRGDKSIHYGAPCLYKTTPENIEGALRELLRRLITWMA